MLYRSLIVSKIQPLYPRYQNQQKLLMEKAEGQYRNVAPKKWWEKFWKKKINYIQLRDRTIITNVPDPQILTNKIETSKYNFISFLPINLIEQFTKLANLYFLLIGILQAIPIISITEGKPTIFITLSIVVLISMIKDFFEDLKRHSSDKKQNEGQIQLLTQHGFSTRQWQDLQVGNIIRVKREEYFPCDVILLDHNKEQKTAFIQTKNLDGETNLKLKNTCEHLRNLRGMSELELSESRIEFSFQKPNPFLSTFNGNVRIGEKKYMIENTNVILRGCSLKINEWAVGLCVYTGSETKILLNSGSQQRKSSSLEIYLNRYFKRIFIFQFVVTLLSALAYGVIYGVNKNNEGYLSQSDNIVVATIVTWGSWFLGFSSFIPIGLLVTVELVKLGQGKLLAKDELCCSRGQYAEVLTSNLNEELGQIEYIMTDKTGTLTTNQMDFKSLYIDGEHFGEEQDLSRSQCDETTRQMNKRKLSPLEQIFQKSKIQNVDFSPSEKNRLLKNIEQVRVRNSLLHLSLCHNVISEKNQYSSSSPDELALVSFAKYIGFQFVEKNNDNVLIIKNTSKRDIPQLLRYKLLHVLEFTSERKRMSVIVQDLNCEERPILLLTKGADQIIIPRTRIYSSSSQHQNLVKVQEALMGYAKKGLRTLVLAQKQISSEYYQGWDKQYIDALAVIGPKREEVIENMQSEIEKDLQIVAATAIEDKLQNKVKETIQDLKRSNIKVWMLTGDKRETAISIGYSCGLIDSESETIVLDCGPEHAKNLLVNLQSIMHELKHKKVTVVSGEFIRKIDDESKSILEQILLESESVICCRVSPKDKEFITSMVKKWGKTLAIGDGANDVNMIHSANVGVGVRGIEGSQATRAADYVITEFRLLKRLVIYHGLNNYHRNSNVVTYTLYKNMLLTFPNLFYGPISLESATYLYDPWVAQVFNLFFTGIPIIYYGIFDILYSYKEMKQKPSLYKEGQNCLYFNKTVLIRALLDPLLASILILYVVFYSTEFALCSRGYMIYKEWSGNLIFSIIVVACNIRIVIMSHQFNIVQGFITSMSVILYPILYLLVSVILATDSKNTLFHQFSTGLYWLLLVLVCFVNEGFKIVENNIVKMKKQIEYFQEKEREIMYLSPSQLHHISEEPKDLEVIGDAIKQRSERQGYAFAEDEHRMSFQRQFELNMSRKTDYFDSNLKLKEINMIL